MPMATNLGKMVTYYEGLPPVKLHDPLITWSSETHDKLETWYLHYQSAYGHQTWQDLTYRNELLTKKLYDILIK